MSENTFSMRALARLFGKIGCLSFGGPAGQIALMQRELVDQRQLIAPDRFNHALSFCMLLPGPEAQQLATYCGWLLHGRRGALAAGILFVLPGALVMLGLSYLYVTIGQSPWADGILLGIKAVVLAIVLEALLRVARRALKLRSDWLIAAAAFVALFFFDVPFPLVVLAAAIAGFWRAGAAPGVAAATETGAPHARYFLATLTLGLLLWLAPVAAIYTGFGETSVFTDIGLFFSKMSVVTFGGAYAVLNYVAQEAVQNYHWLTPAEMIDGLGLAETTPGPLILVLQHVGFLAGWRGTTGMSPLAGGLLGAGLASWVTFTPSILWILVGAPYVEKIRTNAKLTGALGAVTAAVVGVILNMALWFALHVLFRDVSTLTWGMVTTSVPVWSGFQPVAAGLSLAAGYLVLVRHVGIIKIIILGALLGFAAHQVT